MSENGIGKIFLADDVDVLDSRVCTRTILENFVREVKMIDAQMPFLGIPLTIAPHIATIIEMI